MKLKSENYFSIVCMHKRYVINKLDLSDLDLHFESRRPKNLRIRARRDYTVSRCLATILNLRCAELLLRWLDLVLRCVESLLRCIESLLRVLELLLRCVGFHNNMPAADL